MIYPATRILNTEAEFHEAMDRLDQIFDAVRGTPEGDEYEILALLITDWEQRNLEPMETIKSLMSPEEKQILNWFETKVRATFLGNFLAIREICDPDKRREGLEWRMGCYALAAAAEVFGPHDACSKAEYHEICRRGELVDSMYFELDCIDRDDSLIEYTPPSWAKLRKQDWDQHVPEPSGALTDWYFTFKSQTTEEGLIYVKIETRLFATGCGESLEMALKEAKAGMLCCLEFMAEECEDPFGALERGPAPHPEARLALTDLYPIALREARNLKGYTQREMARRMGISKSSYARLELLGAFPHEELLMQIDEVLGARVLARVYPDGTPA